MNARVDFGLRAHERTWRDESAARDRLDASIQTASIAVHVIVGGSIGVVLALLLTVVVDAIGVLVRVAWSAL